MATKKAQRKNTQKDTRQKDTRQVKVVDEIGPIAYAVVAFFKFDDVVPDPIKNLAPGKMKGTPRIYYDWDWAGGYRGNQTFVKPGDGTIPDTWPWSHVGVVSFRSKTDAEAWLKSDSFKFMTDHAALVIRTTVAEYD